MSTWLAVLLFVAGLGLVVYFAGKLVEGVVGTAANFGLSAFLISVVFIGFDPENLAVGAAASYEQTPGIALGSIIGAAMVAIALALGVTALLVPLRFEQVPRPLLAVAPLAVLLMGALALDGQLSRFDGVVLLLGYALAIGFLIWMGRHGLDVKPSHEVAEKLNERELSRWKALGLLTLSLAGIIAGSEILVQASHTIIDRLGLTETVFGMTILALLVSIEELARELPAAAKGRPEITFGNVVGSVLAFFLFNAGFIALVGPVEVCGEVLQFYLPVCLVAVLAVSLFMLRRKVSRSAGAFLVALYLIFALGGYVLSLM